VLRRRGYTKNLRRTWKRKNADGLTGNRGATDVRKEKQACRISQLPPMNLAIIGAPREMPVKPTGIEEA
jgi:hypothetical protein